MQGSVIRRLKEGSIPNVLPYGVDRYGVPPYVIVKLENGIERINVRIIVCFEQGAQALYRPYVFDELGALLRNWRSTDDFGNTFILRDSKDWREATALPDANILAMERVFFAPYRPR